MKDVDVDIKEKESAPAPGTPAFYRKQLEERKPEALARFDAMLETAAHNAAREAFQLITEGWIRAGGKR